MAAARAFYRRLHWRESPSSNADVAFFQIGGLVFGLWSRTALAEDAGSGKPGKDFANITLAHNVRTRAEVERILKKAAKAGATTTKPAEENSGAATLPTSTALPGRSRGTRPSGS